MSETLNDENAAGNDDVSERRAVEHRALEQCDVVHHGVVSGCPVNSCAAVLNEVMSQTGWNAYELAQRTGLDRSAIGRVLRGQRGMLFDVLAEGLERAGFGLHLEAVAPSQTIPEDELHMLLAQLRRPPDFDAIESGATWSTLKMLCVNLIHARNVQHQRISFVRAVARVKDACWIAFLAGLYRFLRWDINPRNRRLTLVPPYRYGLDGWWSPLPSAAIMHVLHRYEEPLHDMDYTYLPLIDYELNAMQRKQFNQAFMEYGILIPADDLSQSSSGTQALTL